MAVRNVNFTNKNITVAEMNELLKEHEGEKLYPEDKASSYSAFTCYRETDSMFQLIRNEGSKSKSNIKIYTCRRDDNLLKLPVSSPERISAAFSKSTKFHHIDKRKEYLFEREKGVAGIHFINPRYEKQWIDAVSYDMNSAYAWGACQDMPNTESQPRFEGRVRKNEIGFTIRGDVRFKGEYADIIFPTMPSPFTDYMIKQYHIKKTTKDPIEKKKAKEKIVIAVGNLENKNYLLRTAIIGYVNRYIMSLTGAYYDAEEGRFICDNNNILFGNTDSIIVKKGYKIPITIGDEMGEWKIENQGLFAYRGFVSQWKGQLPKWSGIMKSKLPLDYDIVRDSKIPLEFELWTFNPQINQLELKHYGGRDWNED